MEQLSPYTADSEMIQPRTTQLPPDSLPADQRAGLAIIINSLPPYRFHVHRRIAMEMPELRLWTVLTHERGSDAWAAADWDQIGGISFGKGESATDQPRLSRAPHEWAKGGRIIRWMKQNNIRAVVCAGYNDAGRFRIIRWCCRHGVPCFIWGDSNIRGDRADGLKGLIKRLYVRKVMNLAAGALPFGQLGVEFFAKYGMDRSRIFLLPLEPDYQQIERITEQQIAQARAKFGLSPNRRRIIFSGRMAPEKRPDLLLEAFAAIAEARPDWDLLMVGDGPLRAQLAVNIPAELAKRVTWTGFVNDQAAVSALYRASDLLVLPSESEPWALVVNEAVAAGLALICSDVVGAAAELVRPGVNGYLFAVGDRQLLNRLLLDATDPRNIDALKAASHTVLADWRTRADPIAGLRKAMQSAGVIAT
jgi:glycosyltransferase involved in cell wall biosynthesis